MHNQLFPKKLSQTLQSVFASITDPPLLLKLLPAIANINACAKTQQLYSFLCKNERDQLQKYTLEKRRSEYLTSRICAKISTMAYLQSRGSRALTMDQVEIKNSENGRPYVKISPAPPLFLPEISLSHSKEYGLALAGQYRCGVDIQRHEPTLKRVQEKYCTNKEYTLLLNMLKKQDELTKLALLWSAKEAVQKSLSAGTMPYFTEIFLRKCQIINRDSVVFTVSFTSERTNNWPEQMEVVAGTFKDYALAITTIEKIDTCRNFPK